MSDRTQDIKNLRAVATACKNYTDKKIEDLRWELGTYDLGVESDNTSALVKTMPSGTIKANVNKIYGASEVSENLIVLSDVTETTTNGITWKVENGVITINGTSTSSITIDLPIDIPNGTYSLGYFNDFTISWSYLQASLMYNSTYIQQNSLAVENAKQSNISATNGINRIRLYIISSGTSINGSLKPMLIKGTTAPTEFKAGYDGIHNIELSGLKVYDSDNVEQVSKTIDLSTILYNGSPLFEGNSLKGVGTAKDYITPYKAHKEMFIYTLTGNETWNLKIDESYMEANVTLPTTVVDSSLTSLSDKLTYKVNGWTEAGNEYTFMVIGGGTKIRILMSATLTQEQCRTLTSGITIIVKLATPIEVSIDWSSTLRGIQGYPNGSITAQNTYDMATTSEIDYLVEEVKA